MRTPKMVIATATMAVLALGVTACGDDDAAETTTTIAAVTTTTAGTGTIAATTTTAGTNTTGGGSEVTEITVTADDLAFDVTEITVKAGQQITVTFVNIDTEAADPHNIHFRTSTEDFFTTPKEATSEEVLVFTANTPGTFTFFCDTHSQDMVGTFIVTP